MLSEQLNAALNAQVALETYSAAVYRQIAATVYALGLDATAAWMRAKADEEREHAEKVAAYVEARGGDLRLLAVDGPPVPADLASAATLVLSHEERVTEALASLHELAQAEGDMLTCAWLLPMLSEQVEEEDRARQFGRWVDGAGDRMTLDQQVGAMANRKV